MNLAGWGLSIVFAIVAIGIVVGVYDKNKDRQASSGVIITEDLFDPPKETPKKKEKSGSGICVGICWGPHYNFNSGQIELGPKMGFGYEFF